MAVAHDATTTVGDLPTIQSAAGTPGGAASAHDFFAGPLRLMFGKNGSAVVQVNVGQRGIGGGTAAPAASSGEPASQSATGAANAQLAKKQVKDRAAPQPTAQPGEQPAARTMADDAMLAEQIQDQVRREVASHLAAHSEVRAPADEVVAPDGPAMTQLAQPAATKDQPDVAALMGHAVQQIRAHVANRLNQVPAELANSATDGAGPGVAAAPNPLDAGTGPDAAPLFEEVHAKVRDQLARARDAAPDVDVHELVSKALAMAGLGRLPDAGASNSSAAKPPAAPRSGSPVL